MINSSVPNMITEQSWFLFLAMTCMITKDSSFFFQRLFGIFFHLVGLLLFKNPQQGAQTSIYCAVSEEMEGVSGKYLADCKIQKLTTEEANSDEIAEQLWQISAQMVGLDQLLNRLTSNQERFVVNLFIKSCINRLATLLNSWGFFRALHSTLRLAPELHVRLVPRLPYVPCESQELDYDMDHEGVYIVNRSSFSLLQYSGRRHCQCHTLFPTLVHCRRGVSLKGPPEW